MSSPMVTSGFQTAGAYTTMPSTAAPVTMAPSVQYTSMPSMQASMPMASSRAVTTTMPSMSIAAPSTYSMPMATTVAAPTQYMQAPTMMATQQYQTVTSAPQYQQPQMVTSMPMMGTQYMTSAPRVMQSQVFQQAPVMETFSVGRNLLLGGNVISERVVSYEELMSSDRLRIEEAVVAPMIVEKVLMEQPVQQYIETFVQPDGTMQEVLVEQPVQYVQDIVQPDGSIQQVLVDQPVEQQQQGGPIEGLLNQAFVFIKPHANTEITQNTVRDMLQNYGIAVTAEGDLTADIIDERKLIDQHYYSIASKATMLKPDQLNVDDAKFQAAFGIPWEAALPNAFNAMDAMEALQSNVDEITQLWGAAKENKKLVKLGGGFYCGLLEKPGFEPLYTFNAFFMNMRQDFVAPGASIHWFTVEWDEKAIPWADFRGQVLGPTDPADAPANSVRGMVFANWQELGLASCPNTGNNGVHASASPLEALYERMNWLGVPCEEDLFGNFLLAQCQVPPEFVDHCAVDPQVNLPDGKTGSVWDYLEDSDASACVDNFVNLVNMNMG